MGAATAESTDLGFGEEPGGGGGGGASDVRTCSVAAIQASCPDGASLASRLLVAGGGGGGGGSGTGSATGGGGGAADNSGTAGFEEIFTATKGAAPGHGGRHPAAAAPANLQGRAQRQGERFVHPADSWALGGEGGTSVSGGGGGGGGGIFGGGGGGGGAATDQRLAGREIFSGGGGGGGGGASGVPVGVAGVSDVLMLATAEGAEPSVSFTWSAPAPTVLTTAASAVTQMAATLNGTVDTNTWQPTACDFASRQPRPACPSFRAPSS